MKSFNIVSYLNNAKSHNSRFSTIAIDGRGASGKSALAEYVKKLLPDFIILNGDDYFEPVENRIEWGDFNDERFGRDIIDPLKHGNSFIYRPYDWHTVPHITKNKSQSTRVFASSVALASSLSLTGTSRFGSRRPKRSV